jgi:hypothetical protein
MLPSIVEDVCRLVSVREVQGIKRVYLLEEVSPSGAPLLKVQTEGVNFEACWEMKQINHNSIQCNDIQAILNSYGVNPPYIDRSSQEWPCERSHNGVQALRNHGRFATPVPDSGLYHYARSHYSN